MYRKFEVPDPVDIIFYSHFTSEAQRAEAALVTAAAGVETGFTIAAPTRSCVLLKHLYFITRSPLQNSYWNGIDGNDEAAHQDREDDCLFHFDNQCEEPSV